MVATRKSKRAKPYYCNRVIVFPDQIVDTEALTFILREMTDLKLKPRHPAIMLVRRVDYRDEDNPIAEDIERRTTVGNLFRLYRLVMGEDYKHNPSRFIGKQWAAGWDEARAVWELAGYGSERTSYINAPV